MSFRDEVVGAGANAVVPKMRVVKEKLGDDWDEFLEIAADPHFSSAAIYRALKKRGIEISESTVRRYRSNQYGI